MLIITEKKEMLPSIAFMTFMKKLSGIIISVIKKMINSIKKKIILIYIEYINYFDQDYDYFKQSFFQ